MENLRVVMMTAMPFGKGGSEGTGAPAPRVVH